MIQIIQNGSSVPFSIIKFSGGEVQVKLNLYKWPITRYNVDLCILAHIHTSDDIMTLLLVTDALRRHGGSHIRLAMPYVPYGRQDRVCAIGESLSLKVFCDIINSQNYDEVTVWDPHSDVSLALLNRVKCITQSLFVQRIKMIPGSYLVAPDAGALKKIGDVSKATGLRIILANKTRDPVTGVITDVEVHSMKVGMADLLIVDDICDGGRTFIELAKKLRPLTTGKISLYVTHGIFSQGLSVFEGILDEIYCPNVFPGVPDHKLLKRI